MQIERDEVTGAPIKLVMRKPADMHQHFREGPRIGMIAPLVAKRFGIALAMPNLEPPLTECGAMTLYGKSIADVAGEGQLRILLTLYLTDKLEPREVAKACELPLFAGIKYYPRGLTTNSDSGVADPAALWTQGTRPYECLKILAEHGRVLLLHGADGFARGDVRIRTRHYKNGDELDPYDQEPHFVIMSLPAIMEAHPRLKISFEHLSTGEGADFLRQYGGPTLGCGLTPQHLLTSRTDTHRRGLRPHNFWFPVPQAHEHTQELNRFAGEGHTFAYLGSDSAPHYQSKKESSCCVGGVMTAHAGIELYAEAFDKIGALEKLEAFASENGPAFYGIPASKERITLERKPWTVEHNFYVEEIADGESVQMLFVPFRLGEKVEWRLAV